MYTLRPIVALADVHPCMEIMYEMRNIHEDKAQRQEGVRHDDAETPRIAKMPDVVTEQVIRLLQSPMPEFSALETRQEKILSQLADLKKQVSTLRMFLKQSNLEAAKKKSHNKSYEEETIKDCIPEKTVNINIVLNVDPLRPPYSIYALQKLWKDTDIKVKSFVHSTIVGLVPIIFCSSTHSASYNTINLHLIYKKVEDLEIVTQLRAYSIVGEVNFLRYLSRLIDAHNYENDDVASVHATDGILDLCCRVRHQASRGKTDEILAVLHEELKQMQWTGKGEPSIADIAAWSTIKQFSSRRKVPRFLYEWFQRCEKAFMDTTVTL